MTKKRNSLDWYVIKVLECFILFESFCSILTLVYSSFGKKQSPLLLEYTGFSANEILDCASIIARKVAEEPVTASNRLLVALKKKYDHRKHMSVSTSVKDPCAHTLLAIHNSSKS